jgi:hypothetical protein
MGNPHVLVYTSQLTVERAPVLDPCALNDLASWLCESGHHDTDPMWTGSPAQHERYDQEKREFGFCNYCRDFAGALLVKFEVRMRENS